MGTKPRSGSLAAPSDLTLPVEGSGTARDILSRALGRLVEELHALAHTAAREPGGGELRALQSMLAAPRGALVSALRRPTVGALLRCLRDRSEPARWARVATELVALLGFDLALQGALPEPVRVTGVPPRLLSLAARVAIAVPSGVDAITFDAGRVVAHRCGEDVPLDLERTDEGPRYHPIAREIVLALTDNNPLAMIDAHPDKRGNAVDLGGRSAAEWVSALGAALDVIALYLPDLRREMDLFVHQIVPVGWHAEKHLSASYQEAIGTLYLSLHPSRMTMVEALIHEFSHTKINALFELDDVLHNAFSPLVTSPIRPDPRPLHGVLLAVHAFLPVARLYDLMIKRSHPLAGEASFRARYNAVRAINRGGAAVLLANGRPTRVGQGVFDEIRRWIAYFG